MRKRRKNWENSLNYPKKRKQFRKKVFGCRWTYFPLNNLQYIPIQFFREELSSICGRCHLPFYFSVFHLIESFRDFFFSQSSNSIRSAIFSILFNFLIDCLVIFVVSSLYLPKTRTQTDATHSQNMYIGYDKIIHFPYAGASYVILAFIQDNFDISQPNDE